MPKKKEEKGLYPDQIEFIKRKVVELGDYRSVCEFYKLRDEVTEFAREEARRVYKIDDLDDYEDPAPKKPKKKAKKESKNVKRKRKMEKIHDEGDE